MHRPPCELMTRGLGRPTCRARPALFESALLAWLPRQRWFGAKTRKIRGTRVVDWAKLPQDFEPMRARPRLRPASARSLQPALFLVEVAYATARAIYTRFRWLQQGTRGEKQGGQPQSVLATLPSAAVRACCMTRRCGRTSVRRFSRSSSSTRRSPFVGRGGTAGPPRGCNGHGKQCPRRARRRPRHGPSRAPYE